MSRKILEVVGCVFCVEEKLLYKNDVIVAKHS